MSKLEKLFQKILLGASEKNIELVNYQDYLQL